MSIIINSNLATSQSSLSLKRASERLSKSLQRISSGNRIVTPSEDAGGLAVAMKLESSLRRATATMNNTQNGISFLQMQDGALKVAGEIVDRMSELKSFYNDVSKNADDRENYNHEFRELQKELASLRSQKFNGVSLFATDASSSGIKIMTSDDGMGSPIELARTGLFENFKSKFGADGKLNSGSNGQVRQLIGDYSVDGGIYDAMPGYTSKDYKEGEVVYRAASKESESGYFMALRDVASGSRITDTQDVTSSWIRVADKNGAGFAEAFPKTAKYDMNNLQFNSKGEAVSYLKGDVIKVQSHWDDPNGFLFLKALNDVPQGIMIDQLLLNNVGTGKLFDFVGRDRTGDLEGKPTSQFGLPNSKNSSPFKFYSDEKDPQTATAEELEELKNKRNSSLRQVMEASDGNNFTPGYVENDNGIYRPLISDWNLKFWSEGNGAYEPGDVIYNSESEDDSSILYEVSSNVKGRFIAGDYAQGDLVFSNGTWFKANEAGYSEQFGDTVYLRSDALIKGAYPTDSKLALGSAYQDAGSGDWYQIPTDIKDNPSNHIVIEGDINEGLKDQFKLGPSTGFDTLDGTLLKKGSVFAVESGDNYTFYKFEAEMPEEIDDGNGGKVYAYEEFSFQDAYTLATLDDLVEAGYAVDKANVGDSNINYSINELLNPTEPIDGNPFWTSWENINWSASDAGDPLVDHGFATNVTSKYSDLGDETVWNKTYYGALNGISVGADYERGDNIFYQGKHYVYVSPIPSSDEVFSGDDGLNDFEQLLLNGAVKELGVHIETTGAGGSANKSPNSFYGANLDLEFVDRLPGSGLVRTSGAARQGDPSQDGDGVFNSVDDQLYNELNPGNDGIYGTMDDFYSSTPYGNVATGAAHSDSDADNNKDLLDLSNDLADFSVADFVDYTQTVANFRAVNGGTMSRINYTNRILEENKVNLESARGRIMDTDIALEASKMARQNVIMQASAAMVTQSNQMQQIVLQLLQ